VEHNQPNHGSNNCLFKNIITSLWMLGGLPSGSVNTSNPQQPVGSNTNGECINFKDCIVKCSPRSWTSSWCVVQQIQQILHF